ncbi:MAG: hypothetical protein WCT50_03290 [Patescibacteria group bacterium]|jgi:hypothetical protein
MKNIKNNNKVLFIPGWLDTGERHGYQNSLDIWNKNVDISRDFKVDYVIAHSVGSLVALDNWRLYKNFKMILVNPVISRRSIFRRWYKFNIYEGIPNSFKKSIKILRIIPALIKTIRLFKVPALDIINTIPKEDLVIIYGENDIHLFDGEIIKKLKEKGIRVQEVKGAGHNYEANIEKAVLDAISFNI